MSVYTVAAVGSEPRSWQSKYGPMLTYKITIRNAEGREMQCDLNQKESSAAPAVGQTLEGSVQNHEYGPRFKKVQQQPGFGGRRGGSPEERASIAMQHAQKAAVDIVRLELEHPNNSGLAERVQERAQHLWQQVRDAEGKQT